ncbi:uncharacterized protein LOC128736463 [Sabethes cyaneus]|uniref:uncharacterized protein LOC128736463 n=1 Tax=Sabethes cyaneus TaxID=53552 RepID=UPI00237E61B9|nr:uncharacterized protein LOC128736463 [Sabethes cyaneus]
MAAERKLADCIRKRKALFVVRDSVEKFVTEFDDEADVFQIPIRLEALDRSYRQFIEIQESIERYDDVETFETHLSERADFETRFCKTKGFLLMKRGDDTPPGMNSTVMQNVSTSSSAFHLRLPKIDLPKFNGDFSRWLSFRDTYSSMVHSNADIPTVAKLQYLLQSLEGEARKPFESVDISADNYASTWDALLKRYDNKRYLKRQLFRAIYDLPPVKKEDSQELHDLVDEFQRHVKALAKLGEPICHWNTPLVNLLSYKLDPATLRAWEEMTSKDEDVTYEQLIDFLYQRARMLKSFVTDLEQRSSHSGLTKVAGSFPNPKKQFKLAMNATAKVPNAPQCIACSEKHFLFQCQMFAKMPVRQRRELVSQKHLCWNCFRSGHQSKTCTSKFNCRTCHEKHHSLLHEVAPMKISSTPAILPNQRIQEPIASVSSVMNSGSANPIPQASLSVQSPQGIVLLQTVSLLVVDQNGQSHSARALLDSASMCNFMTKKLANALNLRRTTVDIAVAGIGEATKQVKRQLTATIRSRSQRYTTTLEFLILKRPTVNLPTVPIDTSTWMIPNLELADPRFHASTEIDMIIGGEVYHELHTGSKSSLGEGLPLVIETVFGWTVAGPVSVQTTKIPQVCHLTTVDRNLEQALQRFWELETVEPCTLYSAEESQCENLYTATTTRESSGRYIVRLPLTHDPLVSLGESRSVAERRFLNLERRLERDPSVKESYHHFMREYETLHHMRRISDPVDDSVPHSYLPHHPVFKESSTTTKTRVVFDASCKSSSGFSVNDKQLTGPVVQEDLLSIIMRFRIHSIAIVADIEKMYRQILLHPNDRPYQRILWRYKPEDPVSTYELQTVTYGFTSSPFLATRTLIQVATDNKEKYPGAAATIRSDFYVDDLLSGADTVESAIQLRRDLSAMLAEAGFPLKKWASNTPEVLVGVPPEDLAVAPVVDLHDEPSVSTLGLTWEPRNDTFRFKVQMPLPASVLTKRLIMSYIARIFDPLGLVGPIITVAKLFMQRLWALKMHDGNSYEWDRPLPSRLQSEWKQFHGTLDVITNVRIPRFVSLVNAATIQLHFFSDASEKAYGACCYVRSESAGIVRVHLLTSKSKVVHLSKPQTIPRLELCAASLSASLFKKVEHSLKISHSAQVYFWTDSLTVLQWLRCSPSRWKTFVANRVSSIQATTEAYTWNHVAGMCNPADAISRGVNPSEILDHPLWWHGPQWLSLPPTQWPVTDLPAPNPIVMPEARSNVVAIPVVSTDKPFAEELFSRFSSFTKLRRTIAYCMRYFRALRACKQQTKLDPFETLSTVDLQEADIALCRLAQREMFPNELANLSSNKRVSQSSPLTWLNPILTKEGIIRVGGRLSNANIPDDAKHPIVLRANHRLSMLIVEFYHRSLLHAGPQLTLATIRQRFWLLNGRNLVRRVYHQCHTCFRCRPTLVQQSMADLPSSRVTPARPFSVSGIDYCGPVYLKSPVRNRAPVKAYIAIFVCFATRAVHIELVSDLSTQAFLAALRRFVARRGKPCEIHSDNGTAFKGAANELHRIFEMWKVNLNDRRQILNWLMDNEIKWCFIPPRAPHFGGLWEAAVKSAKTHLLREIGTTNVPQEDMCTLLAQIEMCLNSRPLTPLPNDPSDLAVLTPGHFLIGTSFQSVPERSIQHVPDNRLSHWEVTQKRFQRIWSRWYPEYLQQLQSRATKGCKQPVSIEPGRIVIIKDDNLPPLQWPRGKILKTHPGKDGITRVVTLKTATSDAVIRPVAKIALLPVPDFPNSADREGDLVEHAK